MESVENRPPTLLVAPVPVRPMVNCNNGLLYAGWPWPVVPPSFRAHPFPVTQNLPSIFPPVVFGVQHQDYGINMDKLLASPSNQKRATVNCSTKNGEFRCNHCRKCYASAPAFHMHLRTHVQGCECPICGKTFSRHWLLQGHIRTHTGEKPFRCQVCSKAFADKSNLRAHVQTHSGVKPFVCRRCNKAFALKSYLSKHEESACVKQTA